MKNIFKIGACVLALTPFVVKADLGMPESASYKAIINKDGGVKCESYEKTFTIKKGETVKVLYEYDKTVEIEYGEEQCSIDMKNIKPYDEFDLKDADEYETNYYILKNATIYKGPGYAFDKIGSVKAGETVKSTHKSGDSYYWSYIEYNGTKGWIYTLRQTLEDNPIAAEVNTEKEAVLVYNNPKIYTDLTMKKVAGKTTIPNGTSIVYDYAIEAFFSGAYYIDYNGIKGWIILNPSNVLFEAKEEMVFTKNGNMILYTKAFDKKSKTKVAVKENEVVTITASNSKYVNHDTYWERFDYNGKTYYLSYEDDMGDTDNENMYSQERYEISSYRAKSDLYIYSSAFSNDGKKVNYKEFETKYYSVNDRYYIENKGWVGTLNPDDIKYISDDDDDIIEENPTTTTTTIATTEPITETTTTARVEEKKENKKMDITTLTVICVSGAVVLAITIMVIISLVNKKKKVKNSNADGSVYDIIMENKEENETKEQ